MMRQRKFVIGITVILMILMSFTACLGKYDGYKLVELPEIGSFYVPQEWECIQEGDFVYFVNGSSDKDTFTLSNCYMLGTLHDWGKSVYDEVSSIIEIEKIELITSEVYSNSVILSESKVEMNGSIINMYSLKCFVTSDKRFSFIVLDEAIDPAVLKLIGNSFDRVNFEK